MTRFERIDISPEALRRAERRARRMRAEAFRSMTGYIVRRIATALRCVQHKAAA